MKKIIVLLFFILISLIVACNNSSDSSDGKVTVSLVNASAITTARGFHAYVYANNESNINDASTVIACNWKQIMNGAASFTLKVDDGNWEATEADWIGSGGTTYDLYLYTADDSGEPNSNDYKTYTFPMEITIDGDMSIEVDLEDDMGPYPDE